MQKLFGLAHKKSYLISDVENMISAENVRYWHRNATYYQPEEEDIDYDLYVEEEFNNTVKIFSVTFEDDNDENGKYLEINGKNFRIIAPWYKVLEDLGYIEMDDRVFEGFKDSEEEMKTTIEEWQLGIAEKKAWRIVEDGYASSW